MKNLENKLKSISSSRHLYKVFEDFITMSAITLQNSCLVKNSPQWQKLEDEYLTIIKQYNKAEQALFVECFGELVNLLQASELPKDVLGYLYMDLGFSSDHEGQYFSPNEINELMAKLNLNDLKTGVLKDRPFFTMSEPACGSGGMILATAKEVILQGFNPANRLWVQAIDKSRIAGLMAYIQLALWGIPAQVIIGNTLTLEFKEYWYTPTHILYGWSGKISQYWSENQRNAPTIEAPADAEPQEQEIKTPPAPQPEGVKINAPIVVNGQQMDFCF